MFHKISLIIVASFLIIIGYYSVGQPFESNAETSSIVVNATVTPGISITAAASPVSFSASMDGFLGGSATADLSWTIKTNNAGGYSVSINKSQKLLTGAGGAGKEFADYSAASVDPTYNWVVPGTGDAELGFAINSLTAGVTADANFLNNGVDTCNTSTTFTSLKCWDVVPTTAGSITVASRTAPTDYNGDAIAIQLKAQITAPGAGDDYIQSGAYTTTVTATASML